MKYLVGVSAGVFIIAEAENPDATYGGTLGFLTLGAMAGVLTAVSIKQIYKKIRYGFVLAGLCPIIGAIIYTAIFADWLQENQSFSLYKNVYAYKDLVEQAEFFSIELLRINI